MENHNWRLTRDRRTTRSVVFTSNAQSAILTSAPRHRFLGNYPGNRFATFPLDQARPFVEEEEEEDARVCLVSGGSELEEGHSRVGESRDKIEGPPRSPLLEYISRTFEPP
ncbi:hypothetical protein K0M31_018938 [Melipona bicolor]|uniref:Uncharacterized protein n=1 Tax=Melipona bicolor TaxID=60889 RepID=A0AA40G5H6_9HYME|nr:hypothetical protein K0M31_018938 [Melipona bicolor]